MTEPGTCPFCMTPIRPTLAEAQAAEWAFGLADETALNCTRGGVLYRLSCPGCVASLIAAPGRVWAEVDPACVEWSPDANANMIYGR